MGPGSSKKETGWQRGKRLPPQVFNPPVEKIKKGWYSDKYFVRTKDILIRDNHHPRVLMQVFPRKDGILCGMDEAIAILTLCAERSNELVIRALRDGDRIKAWETVLTIEGDYSTFAHLETVYLGVMARATSVATAVRKVIEVAQGKMVLFFPARFDHYRVQTTDGYAAFVAGATGVSTDAQGAWWGEEGLGTIPHGLIAAYGGDTVAAALAFDRQMPKGIKRIVLVDFVNDSVHTSLAVARAMGERLWGIRLDTAGDLRDRAVVPRGEESLGVCPELCWLVRKRLDEEGFSWVKIVVSGGFNVERLERFIKLGVPFDAVGVGSSLFKERMDFTADIIQVEGKSCAKVGRKFNPNPRLELVRY